MSIITKSLHEEEMGRMSLNQQALCSTSSKLSSAKDMYQQVASDSLLVETLFSAISDNKSLLLFNTIAIMSSHASDGQPTGEILISRMNLTRRQYYTRINRLVDAGLITKKRTRFILTSLGRVAYETHKTIGIAIQNRWTLNAIDLVQTSHLADSIPTEERQKLIDALLGDCDKIRDILKQHNLFRLHT
jgi:predicted transcriptional regulator